MRAGRRDHVVEDDDRLPLQRRADQVGRACTSVALVRALVHDRELAADVLLEVQRLLDAPLVRAEHHQVVLRDVQAADVSGEFLAGVQVIDRDVEEALDLGRVQVEREDAVGPGAGDQVGDQLRRDRHAALVLAVLPGVAVVGQHGRDPGRAGPLERVQHDEQFHQVLVDRRAGRLDDEHVAAADVLVDADLGLAVGEVVERDAPERKAERLGDPRPRGLD